MTNSKADAEVLTKKVDELLKQRDKALMDITKQINTLVMERDKISEPFQKQIEVLQNEYLDKYLRDCNGNPLKVDDVIINNNTGKKYRVVDRYQQILFGYLGNPRVEVKKWNIDGGLGRVIISLYSDDLKNYTKVE